MVICVKMQDTIMERVERWIEDKKERGCGVFDILECTRDIGLDPLDERDVEMVNQIFKFREYLIFILSPSEIFDNT
jgi:hypothetical protein